MIGPVGFAARNLQRRGFHAILALVGLTVTVSSTTFLLLVGQNLVATLNLQFDSKSTLGISYLFLGYVAIALVLVVIVGFVSAGYLVSTMVSQRTRDIGVIKAAGCQTPRLFAYALTEAMFVFLASSLIGGLLSMLLFVSWTGTLQLDQTAEVTVLAISVLSFLLSYSAARFQVWRIVKATASSAISSQLSNLDLQSIGKPVRSKRLGLTFNMASRTILRNRRFARTVLSISLCIFLSTVILTGALVSWNTSESYLGEAMPPHVLAMGTAQMVGQYVALTQSFSSSTTIPTVNGFNSANLVTGQIVNSTRTLPGVEKVDTRLMNLTMVDGYTAAQIVEDSSGNPVLVPPVYLGNSQVLFVGIDPGQIVPDWHSSNGFLRTTDSVTTVIVGDSLIGGIVQQPLNGSQIQALTVRFNVKGAVIDPVNRGRVVYANVTLMQSLLALHGYNLLLVQTDGSSSTIQAVQQLASQHGLVATPLDPVLSMNSSFVNGLWEHIIILPILTLVLTGAILLSYLSTNYSARFNDYTAIRVLGAKSRYILKLLLWEGGGIVMFCTLLGLPLALIFASFLLVPSSQVRPQDILVTAFLSLAMLSIVAAGSAITYWRRLNRVTVKDLMLV